MASQVTTVYTYQLNGATVDFKIPFDYLSRKFVKVTLLGKDRKELTFMTDYRFMSPTLIRTTKAWGPSDNYNYIEIRRETSARDLIVDFSDGSILRAGDLNIANLQAMHIAEEARSLAADSLGVDDFGNLDARFRKIVNLGDPVGRKDAVTKAYIDDAKDGVIQSRDKALQYRNEAQRFRNEAEGFKNTASSKASEISSKIAKADSLNSQAITNSNKAQQYAGDAQRSASAASTSEKNAKASDKSAADSAARAKADADRVNPDLLVKKTGDTMSGALKLPSLTVTSTSTRSTTRFETSESAYVEFVVDDKQGSGEKAFFKFRDPQRVGKDVCFPKSAYSGSGDIHLATKEETVSKSGDTMTGNLTVVDSLIVGGSAIPDVVVKSDKGVNKSWHFRNNNGNGELVRRSAPYSINNTDFTVKIPNKGGTLALTDDYVPKTGGEFSGTITVRPTVSPGYGLKVNTEGKNIEAGIYLYSGVQSRKLWLRTSEELGGALLDIEDNGLTKYRFGKHLVHNNVLGIRQDSNVNTTFHRKESVEITCTGSTIGAPEGNEGFLKTVTYSDASQMLLWIPYSYSSASIHIGHRDSRGVFKGWYKVGASAYSLREDTNYKRTRSSIAKSKVSEREMRKEIEDLKAQVQELREMLLNVTN